MDDSDIESCELVDIDLEEKKVTVNCGDFKKEFDVERSDCTIIQQGKNPPGTIMVRCDTEE